jgi:GT2 family glycosyltransferase
VSFSIVTYNSEKYIGRLLDAIHACVKGVNFHIFVIDNGSVDQTVKIVGSKGSDVTLIESNKNIGFGAAHNLVLDKLCSDYHVIVNPDIYIDYDIVSSLVAYLDVNQDIGMVSPKILYPDGCVQTQAKRDPKLIYLISRRIGSKILKKYKDQYEMAHVDHEHAFDIEFASGCFMFLRTELFKKLGGFDQRFFLYFEDADLSRELRRYARIQYHPDFYVFHNWERGGAKHVGLLIKQVVSMMKYMRKWAKS